MLFSILNRAQLFITVIIGGLTIALGETAPPPNAFIYIISPKDGDTVTNPLGCSLASLAWVLRQPASTGQTPVTTIC
jgi:hypothetical protein